MDETNRSALEMVLGFRVDCVGLRPRRRAFDVDAGATRGQGAGQGQGAGEREGEGACEERRRGRGRGKQYAECGTGAPPYWHSYRRLRVVGLRAAAPR